MIRSAILLVLLAAPVSAQDAPDGDMRGVRSCHEGAAPFDTAPACIGRAARTCQSRAGGGTTIGIVGCLSSEAEAWDVLLNAEYGLLRDKLAADDAAAAGMGQASRTDALRDAQRAWIAFRDADCVLSSSIWQDGTIRGPVAAQCLLTHTARRALELRDLRRNGEGTL